MAVHFVDAQEGWAVGYNGTILHTDNGGSVGIPDSKFQVSNFKAECFPNPLTSITTIRYELAAGAFVSLEIYNNVGQQVDNLVNSKQLKGDNQICWDTANLPSGIYFYCLTAGKQSVNGKIVVVK